ncbi:MAG: hypothetical protein LBV00_04285 [Propionibacteriaceae bacterium]|nr:hypothetical protein [Propionibacteriaceae bacterium]
MVVQSDDYDTYQSSITCLFTTVENANDSARVRIDPDETSGLELTSFVMVDKVFL